MKPSPKYIALVTLFFLEITAFTACAQELFKDEFENGLRNWVIQGKNSVSIIDSGNPVHNRVLALQPNGNVYALIKGSSTWRDVSMEGEVYFPHDDDAYLGFIYNFRSSSKRSDFGCIYLKGDGSYIQVNPRRDGNASRLLYEEFTTYLKGKDSVSLRQWYPFKVEVLGKVCHVYIGKMDVPKLVFPYYEADSGMFGFEPRITGSSVWVDNVHVRPLKTFSTPSAKPPVITYFKDSLITKWEAIGPFAGPSMEVESQDHPLPNVVVGKKKYSWDPFETDSRGAVVTGRFTEYNGNKPLGYFRTIVRSEREQRVFLWFSSVDEIGLYVNANFYGFVYRQGYVSGAGRPWNAWFDFFQNPRHAGRSIPINLKKGDNQIVLRIRNGDFASGGFFMTIRPK